MSTSICTEYTDFSLLDGYGTVEEYAKRATEINQQFLCVSDHGMMAVIPRQIRACEENGIKPIYAIELYVQDKHPAKDDFAKMTAEEKKAIRKSYHLLAIAYNNTGYRNLVQLSSWAWLNGFYYRPRVTHEQLMKHKEGIIFTSCCYNSEIGQAFDKGGEEAGFQMIEKYMAMFGENFYLEIMLLDFNKQKPYDIFIVKAHDKYHLPIIITGDVHFCEKEHSKFQRYMLMIQKDTSIKQIEKKLSEEDRAEIFELQDTNLWMKSERELNEKWLEMYQDAIPLDLFIKAKETTVQVCHKAKGVEIDRTSKLPQFPDADERLKECLIAGMKWRGQTKSRKYVDRLKEEYELICRKGFASYFLIQKQMTDEARRICPQLIGWGDGSEAVGPGRGCLSGDTKVVTFNGMTKRMDEMVVGDRVITADGTAKRVLDVLKYPVNEPLLEVKTFYGHSSGVKLTKDHLVLSEKCHKEEPGDNLQWTRADQLAEGDWVFIPLLNGEVHSTIVVTGGVDVQNKHQCRPIPGALLCRIWSIKEVNGISDVYDLTVEDNHNYLTTSFLVHNSGVGSLSLYYLGVTDVDPIRHNLLFSRFLSESRGGKTMKMKFSGKPIKTGKLSDDV